jgi:SAM-dependent methyltransferase
MLIANDIAHLQTRAGLSPQSIRTRAQLNCVVCEGKGAPLYSGLTDRLFGAPGEWSLRRCAGRNCGLIWLDPAPVESDMHLAYQSYYTHSEAENSHWLRRFYRRLRRKTHRMHIRAKFGEMGEARHALSIFTWLMLGPYPPTHAEAEFPMRYLPAPRTGRVLELGFGQGITLGHLRNLGWDAHGLETDQVAVGNARRKGLNVACGSLAEQHYPAGHYDAVISNHVIEHVPEPRDLFTESGRILRTGGRFIAATPNANCLARRTFGSAWRGLEPPRHLQIFTAAALRALGGVSGFESCVTIASVRGAAGAWDLSRRMHSQLARSGGHAAEHPARARIPGLTAEIAQFLLSPMLPELAEEIILVATK